jgi:branched-chain amino acid transport system permease protein
MTLFLQFLIEGIILGSIYALISLGYTMVYGIIKLINFAHGDIMMIGAFTGYFVTTKYNIGLFPAIIIAILVCSVLGVAIEKVAYKPVRNSSRISALITAIGVSFLLEYGMVAAVGADSKSFNENVVPDKVYHYFNGQLNIKLIDYIIFFTSIALMIALQLIVKKTKIGRAMRAVSQDADAAQLMGINVDRVISFTFILGSSLAAVAGVLYGVYCNSIDPLMGITPGLKAFVAAVFGGIGSIPGAMVGGLSLGIIETLVSGYASSMYKDAAAFVILIIILIIKPSGLFGKNIKEKV